MGKISVLNELLANKIAAGEVVERPASVVKELVENALDAGATDIEVELQQGGLELIKVADNGSGIPREDAPTAFERHATSKIKDDKDLFRISTLGFRGEALPSIAAVSKVQMITRVEEADAGTVIAIEGGHMGEIGVAAARKGTELQIRDLFFNTPARLKYLRSIQTELGHTIDFIERMSLAHPDVAFRLSHNDRMLVQTPGDGKLLHAVAAIYGKDYARQMVPVEWKNYDYKITGLAGYPELNRANRNHCTFFVNGRYIKSFQLFNAVQAAYHTRLPIHRFPVCIINIELDPSLVDVNVHPTKLEVRFSEERDVLAAVQNAVQTSLDKETFIPKAFPSTPKTVPDGGGKEKSQQAEMQLNNPVRVRYSAPLGNVDQVPQLERNESPYAQSQPKPQRYSGNYAQPQRSTGNYSQPGQRVRENFDSSTQILEKDSMEAAMDVYRPQSQLPMKSAANDLAAPSAAGETAPEATPYDAQISGREQRVPRFRPVAQALGMYVIAEDEQGLYIIDQHAAHEKVLYERFAKQLADKEIGPLPLLVPLTLELSAAEGEKLRKHFALLAEYHIDIDTFGGSSFLIRSVPDIWGGLDVQRLTSEFIDELLTEAQAKDPRALIEDKIIMKSCKSAIKANQWLSMPEMTALCDQLSELENPFNCPHGRPIIIHMTRYDLEKQFKRVM